MPDISAYRINVDSEGM